MKKRNQVKRRRHKDLVVVDLKDSVQNSKAGSHRHVDEGGKVFSRGGRQPPDPDPNRFSVDCNAPVPLSWAEVGGARMPTRPRAVDEETATWLILPVVICLYVHKLPTFAEGTYLLDKRPMRACPVLR